MLHADAPDLLREWVGLIEGQRRDEADVVFESMYTPSPRGASGAFRGYSVDGDRYFIKPTNNPVDERTTVTDQIVGRVAELIEAPVPPVFTMLIPELPGDELVYYCSRRALQPGIAHASLEIRDSEDTRILQFRDRDDNANRHLRIMALFDWCWGNDQQWIYDLDNDLSYYSHDHGHYFPTDNTHFWSKHSLLLNANDYRRLKDDGEGITEEQVDTVAELLRGVTREQILSALIAIPASWSVSDEELEHVGYFLEHRAPMVADRLETRFAR